MNEVTVTDRAEIMEAVLLKGDLGKLNAAERNSYYMQTCASLGLNPLTRPFDYIVLSGKTTLYAKRDAADQLRKINGVNIEILSQRMDAGLFIVTVRATDKTGRQDEDMGVVSMPAQGAGEAKANAMLKAITKAKRRVTLSICGLGFLDETEVEDIPASAKRPAPRSATKVIQSSPPALSSQGEPVVERPASSPSDLPSDDAGMSQDELADIDERLAEAATRGWKALKEAWEFLADDVQDELRDNLNRIHKPNAKAVGP